MRPSYAEYPLVQRLGSWPLIAIYLAAITLANLTVALAPPLWVSTVVIVNAVLLMGLWQMLPGRAPQDHVYGFSADIKLIRHLVNAWPVWSSTPNLKYLGTGQSRETVFLAPRKIIWPRSCRVFIPGEWATTATALFVHISSVIFDRPKEEMVGIDACAVIACVKNPKTACDIAVMQFPGCPMRSDNSMLVCRHDRPIPLNFAACPLPAWSQIGTVGLHWSIFIDFGPEAPLKAPRSVFHAFSAAKSSALCRLACFHLELFVAILTSTGNAVPFHQNLTF